MGWIKNLFMSKNKLYRVFNNLDNDQEYLTFLNENLIYLKKYNISPWTLLFHGRLPVDASGDKFIRVISVIYLFIKNNNLTYSLNSDEVFIMKKKEDPLL